MPNLAVNELEHMRDAVFFEGSDVGRRLSRFWILLVLAAIIASAGVIADSTATVIGAMIVAPLMTPILGTMLGVVLADRANLLRSIGLVVSGAAAAIAIGYVMGLFIVNDVVASSNSQVSGRVSPGLVELVAALATGVVGSVALVRRDISDTLPGVAIAISLVPPLAVVGLTAESGEYGQAAGALLLFATNVAAILTTGIIVMALYRVQNLVEPAPTSAGRTVNRRRAIVVIVAFFVVVGVPLTISTVKISRDGTRETTVRRVTTNWASDVGWDVLDVTSGNTGVTVRLIGPPPLPDTSGLAASFESSGINPNQIVLEFIPKAVVTLGAPQSPP